MTNPYSLVGRVAVGGHLVHREALARRIQQAWSAADGPGNLSVLGHHRTGKTSLVRQAAAQCDHAGLHTVVVTVGSGHSVSGLFHDVVGGLLERIDPSPQVEAVGEACLLAEEWDDLRDAVRAFFKAVANRHGHAMIVLDEFDYAGQVCRDLAPFQLLRSLASEPEYRASLITISRRRIRTIEGDAANGSVLDGVVSVRRPVGMFTDAEADVMLGRAAELGLDLVAAREEILDLTGLHPYLLELLCQSIVGHFEDTGKLDVRQAYEHVMDSFADHFDQLLRNLERDRGAPARQVLVDLAEGRPPPGAGRLRQEFNQLRQTGLVSPDRHDPARYRLFSAEFGRHLLAA